MLEWVSSITYLVEAQANLDLISRAEDTASCILSNFNGISGQGGHISSQACHELLNTVSQPVLSICRNPSDGRGQDRLTGTVVKRFPAVILPAMLFVTLARFVSSWRSSIISVALNEMV